VSFSEKQVIVIGYSGHAFVVIETILENGIEIIGYTDREKANFDPFKLPYLGFEKDDDFEWWNNDVSFVLGIGDNKLRQNIGDVISHRGKKIQKIVHKTAQISKSAVIGPGTFVNRNVAVNAFALIGKNVILNTGCIIEHECILEDAVHIAPGAVLAGNVCVGERTFVGANAVVKQGVVIGKDVIIGAGTVVLKNVPDGKKIVGNPGKII